MTFRRLDPALAEWYLASGEWRERAGGYAIQGKGAALVERIDGDYWNVVGLPVALLVDMAPELSCAASCINAGFLSPGMRSVLFAAARPHRWLGVSRACRSRDSPFFRPPAGSL